MTHRALVLLAVLLLAGCAAQPPAESRIVGEEPAPATTSAPPTAPAATAVTAQLPTPTTTPTPAPPPQAFRAYRHPSQVFALAVPETWEALDESTPEQILVRFVPPQGYGSRAAVEATHEGPLTPEQVQQLAEHIIQLHYGSQPGYTELERTPLADGMLQARFAYDDGQGGRGTETLVLRQAGPFVAALRIFAAEGDLVLAPTLGELATSFTVDPLAPWGTALEEVDPAALAVENTSLWRDRQGVTHYMGEVRNNTGAPIASVGVRAALCSEEGVVMAEVTPASPLQRVPAGESAPFAASVDGLPAELSVCAEEPNAQPAAPDPAHSTALVLDLSIVNDRFGQPVLTGSVTNPGLAPLGDVEIVLLAYDGEGRLVGLERLSPVPGAVLRPGEAAPYEQSFDVLGADPQRFVARGQAYLYELADPALAPEGG